MTVARIPIAAVREAVVVGRSEPDLGEHVEAFVSLNSPCSQTALIKFCRQRLSSHKVPDAIHILDELPRTAAGKISRKALVEPPGAFLTDTR
jgi:acyl-coenzyme A synthetase/AMP-(fatty) acid ligase